MNNTDSFNDSMLTDISEKRKPKTNAGRKQAMVHFSEFLVMTKNIESVSVEWETCT